MQAQPRSTSNELDVNRDYYIAYEYGEHINVNDHSEHSLLLTISGRDIKKCLPYATDTGVENDFMQTLEHEILLLGRLETGHMSVGSYNKKSRLFRRKIEKGTKKFNRDFPLYLALYLAFQMDALLEDYEGALFFIDTPEKDIGPHPMHHENAIFGTKFIADQIFQQNRNH